MLIKIAFTLAVIVGVIVFFRLRRAGAPGDVATTTDAATATDTAAEQGKSISPRVLAYGLLGVLGGVAVLIFVLEMIEP